ncbi:uncharacterized protein O3C94_010324 isoform 1-T2 [Discoglossus pictus]
MKIVACFLLVVISCGFTPITSNCIRSCIGRCQSNSAVDLSCLRVAISRNPLGTARVLSNILCAYDRCKDSRNKSELLKAIQILNNFTGCTLENLLGINGSIEELLLDVNGILQNLLRTVIGVLNIINLDLLTPCGPLKPLVSKIIRLQTVITHLPVLGREALSGALPRETIGLQGGYTKGHRAGLGGVTGVLFGPKGVLGMVPSILTQLLQSVVGVARGVGGQTGLVHNLLDVVAPLSEVTGVARGMTGTLPNTVEGMAGNLGHGMQGLTGVVGGLLGRLTEDKTGMLGGLTDSFKGLTNELGGITDPNQQTDWQTGGELEGINGDPIGQLQWVTEKMGNLGRLTSAAGVTDVPREMFGALDGLTDRMNAGNGASGQLTDGAGGISGVTEGFTYNPYGAVSGLLGSMIPDRNKATGGLSNTDTGSENMYNGQTEVSVSSNAGPNYRFEERGGGGGLLQPAVGLLSGLLGK